MFFWNDDHVDSRSTCVQSSSSDKFIRLKNVYVYCALKETCRSKYLDLQAKQSP